jgi:hypothetical protein
MLRIEVRLAMQCQQISGRSERLSGSCRCKIGLRHLTLMLVLFMGLTGCAGGLTQSFKQSLSVFAPEQIDFADLGYYAKRSQSAYDPIDQIRRDYPLATRVSNVASVDVQYFIETDLANRNQTLSVRGTARKPNVWEDIETALIPDSILGIPLHNGFRKDSIAVYKDATPHLRKDLPLRVTGHSLGGAVAVILAAYLQDDGYLVERVVTFGQPKISSTPPDESILAATTRVVNDKDVVPMLPPHTAFRNYQHFAPEVILKNGPNFVYLDAHDADRLSVGDFWRNITDFSFKEHHVDLYVANIAAKAQNGARQVPYLFNPGTVVQPVAASN